MNTENGNLVEFLHDIEKLEGMKKKFILNLEDGEKSLSVYYKSYKFSREIFNVYFADNDNFSKYKEKFKKGSEYQLVITETDWKIVGGYELKPFPGEKKFIRCQIIDIRKNFFKIKILQDIV